MAQQQVSPEEFDQRQARLGIDAAGFKNTPIGQYLLDRADMVMESTAMQRMEIDPNDVEKNTELMIEYKAARMLKLWIDEAYHSGMAAAQRLDDDYHNTPEQ